MVRKNRYSAVKILVLQSLRIFHYSVPRNVRNGFRAEKGKKPMAEMVKVVVDAMGGDNAPVEPVKAAVEAVKEKTEHPGYPYRTGRCDPSRTSEIFRLSRGQDPCGTRISGHRNSRASGNGNPEKERFFDCSRIKPCKKTGSRRICFLRKYRCSPGRRPGDRRQDQRNPETTPLLR